jgi:hypothetical protein
MPAVLVVLFWCWFAVSAVILLRRLVRKVSGPRKPVAAPRPAREWPPLHEIDPVPAADDAPAEDAPTAPATPTAVGRNLFTREPRGASIASVLDGIRLPCDLAPLTGLGEGEANTARRATFYTVGYPAEAVAPEIADELERLGLEFNPLTENTAVARRDDVQVRVAVHAVGSAYKGVADVTFPTAPEHSVVVEFELT